MSERLTKRINGVVVYVGTNNPHMTGQIPCEVEPAGVREMMVRLAAYEDKGLEPEEVLPKDKADETALKLMRLADLESLCSYTRLCELPRPTRTDAWSSYRAGRTRRSAWSAGASCGSWRTVQSTG